MKIVNLFGGPGSGKSTTAAGVFHRLKLLGYNAELVTEFAKDLTWEDRTRTLRNQLYVLGKQHQKQARVNNKVDILITDSPLLLSIVYSDLTIENKRLREAVSGLAYEAFMTFDNINIFLRRVKEYNPAGRNQTEEEAVALDHKIRTMLQYQRVPFYTVTGDAQASDAVLDYVRSIVD